MYKIVEMFVACIHMSFLKIEYMENERKNSVTDDGSFLLLWSFVDIFDAYRSNADDPVKVMYVHMNKYAEQSRQNLST